LRRALQRFIEDPLSEALIAGQFSERPLFLEVYLLDNKLFYRPVGVEGDVKAEGALLNN
jgi:ATP-dependent Clp protease ATP-binding subunit ClpC